MSTNLYWINIAPMKPKGTAGLPLKSIIAKKFFGNDGSISSDPILLKFSDHAGWLEGLIDCGIKEAKRMLKDLSDYGELEVWIAE